MSHSLAKLTFKNGPDQILFRVIKIDLFRLISEFIEKLVSPADAFQYALYKVSRNPLAVYFLFVSFLRLLMEVVQ